MSSIFQPTIIVCNSRNQKITPSSVISSSLINDSQSSKSNEATAVEEHNYSNSLQSDEKDNENTPYHNVYHCTECKKSFVSEMLLYRHSDSVHSSRQYNYLFKRKGIPTFKCKNCSHKFKKLYHLRLHRKTCLAGSLKYQPIKHTCLLCNGQFNKKTIMDHFTKDHGLEIETENLEFNSFEAFNEWRIDIEKKSKCLFKKDRNSRPVYYTKYHYFSCHRSGQPISHSKGMKRPKCQGSCKIGGFCPASIRTIEHPDGTCSVYFVKTHVGHEASVEHISLSFLDGETIPPEVVSAKLKVLGRRHRMGDLLDAKIDQVEDGWTVTCSVNEAYYVYEDVVDCNCKLICSRCKSCVHHYKCTCADSAVKFNMCKHIHAVCTFRNLSEGFEATEKKLFDVSEQCGNVNENTSNEVEQHDKNNLTNNTMVTVAVYGESNNIPVAIEEYEEYNNDDEVTAVEECDKNMSLAIQQCDESTNIEVEQCDETALLIQHLSNKKIALPKPLDTKLQNLRNEYMQIFDTVSNGQEIEVLQQYLTSINTTLSLLKSNETNLFIPPPSDLVSDKRKRQSKSYSRQKSKKASEAIGDLPIEEIKWYISEEVIQSGDAIDES